MGRVGSEACRRTSSTVNAGRPARSYASRSSRGSNGPTTANAANAPSAASPQSNMKHSYKPHTRPEQQSTPRVNRTGGRPIRAHVALWLSFVVMSLLLVLDLIAPDAPKVAWFAIGGLWAVLLGFALSVALLGSPRWIVAPKFRGTPGALKEWSIARRGG